MGHELNYTYQCINKKHTKTYRRNRHEPVPICPICGSQMERIVLHPKSWYKRNGISYKKAKKYKV